MKVKTLIKNTLVMVVMTVAVIGTKLYLHESEITKLKNDPNLIKIQNPDDLDSATKEIIKTLTGGTGRPQFVPFDRSMKLVSDRNANIIHMFSIDDETFYAFERESTLMSENGAKEITINLHSPGGSVWYAGYIVDHIRVLKERGVKVTTVIGEQRACMSACPFIFLEGDERIAYNNSVIMIHSPYIIFPAKVPESIVINEMRNLRRDRHEFSEKFAKHCPTYPEIKMDIFDNEDHYYTAKDLSMKCSDFFTMLVPTEEAPAMQENILETLSL